MQSKPKDPRLDPFVRGGRIERSAHYQHIPAPPQEILARELETFRSLASECQQPQLEVPSQHLLQPTCLVVSCMISCASLHQWQRPQHQAESSPRA